ncbi:MAG TPA: glycosyltransferase family 39 protein [Geminicoccaceae bacterium]|nr:glycosyltransferase family 39 protein [Geminicoccaceae bacterium]
MSERNGGRAGLAMLIAILLLGLGLRTSEAWDGRSPVFDAAAYAKIAANLNRGEGFTLGPSATQPASNYSPGLPLLVAGVYELGGGTRERVARLLLALIGTLAVLFTYLIGRRLSGPGAGLIGAAAIAIYPALLEYQGMLMGEPLAATLLAAAGLATLWADDSEGWPRWLLPGALFGALTLVRPEYLGVALLVSLVVFARGRTGDLSRTLVRALFLLLGAALIVAPWTLRNAVELDRFVPVSTGGGQVLFAGTYLPSDGDPERVGAEVVERHPALFGPRAVERLRLEQILERLAEQRYPGTEPDKALSKMGKEQLWDDLSEEPLEYAGFVATKVWRAWTRGQRQVMQEPGWKLFHWALLALGLAGLIVLALQRRWEALLIAVILLGITAISALLVASPRRVLVLMPLIAALAGAGASAAVDQLRMRIRD